MIALIMRTRTSDDRFVLHQTVAVDARPWLLPILLAFKQFSPPQPSPSRLGMPLALFDCKLPR